jgi:serine/threonine protein phosphatase PrpC
MLDIALARGAPDNVTIIVMSYLEDSERKDS